MTTFAHRSSFVPRDSSRFSSLAVVVVVHVLAFYLLTLSPAREAISKAAAIMVTLIQEQPRVKQKPTELPKSLPVKSVFSRLEAIPIPVVANINAPAEIVTRPPELQPPAQPVRPQQTAPQAATVPPKFDADYLDNPPPVYPQLSKRLGEFGSVMLMVFVDVNGNPGQIDIQTSSRFDRLDHAGIDAVRRWRFVPAKQGDKAVAAWVLVLIVFSLKT